MHKAKDHIPSHDKEAKKIYTEGWIAFATFLGGPLGGIYMASRNFHALGEDEKGTKTLQIGGALFLGLVLILLFTPSVYVDKIPNSVFTVFYVVVIAGFVRKTQHELIEKFLKKGGKKESGWKATGIGFLSVLITFLIFVAILLVVPESIIPE